MHACMHAIINGCVQINNAGVNFNFGSENSVENAQMVCETNYFGTKRMIEAMIPLMKPSSHCPRIVNVSTRLSRLSSKRNVSNYMLYYIIFAYM